MRPLLQLLLLLLAAAAQAWYGGPINKILGSQGALLLKKSLSALPRGSDWRYLPLQQMSRTSLFAVAARLLFVPPRRPVDWAKYLPLESSARISKALMKATLLNGAQQFVMASTPAAVVADSAASQRTNGVVSSLVDWVVNLLVSLKVIQRKVQQSIQLEPIAARTVVDTFSSAEYEAGTAWALKRLQEMEEPSVAAVAVAAVAEAEVVIFEAVAADQKLPTSDLALAFDAAVSLRRSYWPAAGRHLELLARSNGSDLASAPADEAPPKGSLVTRRTYWPARYW